MDKKSTRLSSGILENTKEKHQNNYRSNIERDYKSYEEHYITLKKKTCISQTKLCKLKKSKPKRKTMKYYQVLNKQQRVFQILKENDKLLLNKNQNIKDNKNTEKNASKLKPKDQESDILVNKSKKDVLVKKLKHETIDTEKKLLRKNSSNFKSKKIDSSTKGFQRKKCIRHFSDQTDFKNESRKNQTENLNYYSNLTSPRNDKICSEKLLNSLLILDRTICNSINNLNTIESEENENGGKIVLNSLNQSASIVSFESIKKRKLDNKNILSLNSLLLGNLSHDFKNSSKSKINLISNSRERLFYSQVNVLPKQKIKEKKIPCNKKIYFKDSKSELYGDNNQDKEPFLLSFLNKKRKSIDSLLARDKNEKSFIFLQNLINLKLKGCFSLLRNNYVKINFENKLTICPDDKLDSRKKLMIQNIPNKFTILQLVKLFSVNYENDFDFLYLVLDPQTKCNKGFAFINMTSISAKYRFYKEFHNFSWINTSSNKRCEITYAQKQMKDDITPLFLKKYFQEFDRFYVPSKFILEKFPNMKMDLEWLEKKRQIYFASKLRRGSILDEGTGYFYTQTSNHRHYNNYPFYGFM